MRNVQKYKGHLTEFFDQMITHVDQLKSSKHIAIVQAISSLSESYDKTTVFLEDNETDRSRALIFSIAEQDQDSVEIQEVLKHAINSAGSLAYAAQLVIFLDPQRNRIVTKWNMVDMAQLLAVYGDVVSRRIEETGKTLVELEPEYWPLVLRLWPDRVAKLAELERIASTKPEYLGRVVEPYVEMKRPGKPGPLSWFSLKGDWNVEALRELVQRQGNASFESDRARVGIDELLMGKEPDDLEALPF